MHTPGRKVWSGGICPIGIKWVNSEFFWEERRLEIKFGLQALWGGKVNSAFGAVQRYFKAWICAAYARTAKIDTFSQLPLLTATIYEIISLVHLFGRIKRSFPQSNTYIS